MGFMSKRRLGRGAAQRDWEHLPTWGQSLGYTDERNGILSAAIYIYIYFFGQFCAYSCRPKQDVKNIPGLEIQGTAAIDTSRCHRS